MPKANRTLPLTNSHTDTFAETIAARYLDEEVELYMGNSLGSQLYADYESSDNAIIDCIIKGAIGEMLIVDCTIEIGTGEEVTAEVCLHGWAVEAVMRKDERIPLLAIVNMPEHKKKNKLNKRRNGR